MNEDGCDAISSDSDSARPCDFRADKYGYSPHRVKYVMDKRIT